MTTAPDLRTKIFADGADAAEIVAHTRDPLIKGFTTNPTLMRAAGVTDYEDFARRILDCTGDRPVSLEVFADDPDEMERQARKIARWGSAVHVKVPIIDTRGGPLGRVLGRLAAEGVKLNVTALLTVDQVRTAVDSLASGPHCFVSVFAGRIADTGRDPVPLMREALAVLAPHPNLELVWASPREVLNVVQADAIGCHVITLTADILKKLALLDRDLTEFSLDTVRMFHRDARAAGYAL